MHFSGSPSKSKKNLTENTHNSQNNHTSTANVQIVA